MPIVDQCCLLFIAIFYLILLAPKIHQLYSFFNENRCYKIILYSVHLGIFFHWFTLANEFILMAKVDNTCKLFNIR